MATSPAVSAGREGGAGAPTPFRMPCQTVDPIENNRDIGAVVQTSVKLGSALAKMMWLTVALSAAAAVAMLWFGAPAGVRVHPGAVLAWTAFGVLVATFQSIVPLLVERQRSDVVGHIVGIRLLLLTSALTWATGLTAVTGGVRGPMWVCFLGVVLFAAVRLPMWQSAVFAVAACGGLVLASALARTLDVSVIGPLILIGPTFVIVAWFNAKLSGVVWALQSDALQHTQSLEAQASDMSTVLQRAASGDLTERVYSGDHPQLASLSTAFNSTLGNLRDLVSAVRAGGEQIGASAGQLLATAEEHAASATQQSSAVSETTSTIEELAATAAQIAETSEAVARYASETLRFAEEGRTAVSASVQSMDNIAVRVDGIAARALSLGGEVARDRTDPGRDRRSGRSDQSAGVERRDRGGEGR